MLILMFFIHPIKFVQFQHQYIFNTKLFGLLYLFYHHFYLHIFYVCAILNLLNLIFVLKFSINLKFLNELHIFFVI